MKKKIMIRVASLGAVSYTQLGHNVAVAGQIQGDPRFPEAAWPYLDFAKIGAEYYAEHGGAYTYAGYVLRKQDDELVREKKSKIQLDLSSSQAQVSICLPATKEELERVKRTLGIDCFAEAAVTKVSFSVPYMDEHIPTTGAVSYTHLTWPEAERRQSGRTPHL